MTLSTETYKKIFTENSHLLEADQFERIVKNAQQTHRPLEQLLMERSFISPSQLLELLSAYFEVPSTELKIRDIKPEAVKTIPDEFATNNGVIAFAKDEQSLKVALVDPSQKEVIAKLQDLTNLTIKPYVARDFAVKRALVLYDGSIDDVVKQIFDKNANIAQDNGDSEHLARSVIETAIMIDASDIHIEPFESELIIRFRVDGNLRTVASLPPVLHSGTVAYLKIAAQLKIDQKRLPQDGRFTIDAKGQEVNIRISTVPSLWGEKVVLRVLPKESHQVDLANLGLLADDLKLVKEYLKRPFGLILVCGPTGAGKSSTLYASLQEIGNDRIDIVNISTIEDPIEYTIPRVTQIQTQPDIDLTFANGLRALLRQDPDIIMVGEIRDVETAEFSVRASLVGRLVLSSIHTNDAVGAIPRLLDMGVEPYLVSSTLMLVIGQRLARKLCTNCRESYVPGSDVITELNDVHDFQNAIAVLQAHDVISQTANLDELRFYRAHGCEQCGNTGYNGRVGIFEILEISDQIRQDINNSVDTKTLKDSAIKSGMKTMFQDGMAKVLLGTIDLSELIRVVYN